MGPKDESREKNHDNLGLLTFDPVDGYQQI
jgi:hypothetical protein